MRFINNPSNDLTYEDVFLIPSRSQIASRMDVDLSSQDSTGTTIPIVVANMTAISGRRMAETIARRGGIAVIPQDIPIQIVSDVIKWVKECDTFFDTPVTLSPTETVADALDLINKRAHGALIVVSDGKPVGIVTEADCERVDRFTQVEVIMSKDLVTLPSDIDPRAAFDQLHSERRRLAPVIDNPWVRACSSKRNHPPFSSP